MLGGVNLESHIVQELIMLMSLLDEVMMEFLHVCILDLFTSLI